MSHEIFGEKFLSHREPAWHRIGKVLDTPVTASDALQIIGDYNVYMEKMVTESGVPTDYRAIMRDTTPEDDQKRVFGVVKGAYKLVTPSDFCGVWDLAVRKEIETIGVLKRGEQLFISTKLPKFGVKGDECDNYMLAFSPMTGLESIEIMNSPVRTVCQNTLRMARATSSEFYTITHKSSVLDDLGSWLEGIYQRALARAEALQEAFEAMTTRQVTNEETSEVLANTYFVRSEPQREEYPTDKMFEARHEQWETDHKRMSERRVEALELFQGKGTGMDTEAAKGTPWGLYNSVVELEDYRKGKFQAGSVGALVGNRARFKERAFDNCVELVKN